eukprot:scaffold34651_cov152-Isochrysis_galbana.AAC.3
MEAAWKWPWAREHAPQSGVYRIVGWLLGAKRVAAKLGVCACACVSTRHGLLCHMPERTRAPHNINAGATRASCARLLPHRLGSCRRGGRGGAAAGGRRVRVCWGRIT